MEKKTGKTFNVKTDKGKLYTVVEFVTMIDVSEMNKPKEQIEGLKRFRTTTGLSVNQKSETDYEVLDGALIPARRV